jgi:hypothetical protein
VSLDTLSTMLAVALLALMIAGALSPLETLGWWAGWYGRSRDAWRADAPPADAPPPRDRYLVFLSGIHSVSNETQAGREIVLLERLAERLPELGIVQVFPYSVTNRALTGQRIFSWFWRWLHDRKLSGRTLAGLTSQLINLRNLWQVAVSADRRYGPLYNQGSAELIARTLIARGYDPERGATITLIGYSGGAQIAAGAAPHLLELVSGAVEVISLGGVLSADPGLLDLERLYLLNGRRDRVQRLGAIVFPGRWPLLRHSSWNRARAQGRIHRIDMGPADHTGRWGYFDSDAVLQDGRSYLDVTVDVLSEILHGGDPTRAALAVPID